MSPVARITVRQALAWRLRQQHLNGECAAGTAAAIHSVIGLPAWSGDPALALRVRLGRPGDDELAEAVRDGHVIRTYAWRGATHYMTPADARIHLAVRAVGRQWELPSWRKTYGLEPADWPPLLDLVCEALRAGPLTRTELATKIAVCPRFAHLHDALQDKTDTLLKPMAWQGALRLGPSPHSQFTLQSMEDVPDWTGVADSDDAGREAITAYLRSYGPATRDRLHYWLVEGLSAGRRNIDRWLADLGTLVSPIDVDGTTALARTEDMESLVGSSGNGEPVFTGGHDPWILGAGTADEWIVPQGIRHMASAGKKNIVLIGGRLAGTWTITGSEMRVTWLDGAGPDAPNGHSLQKAARAILGDIDDVLVS